MERVLTTTRLVTFCGVWGGEGVQDCEFIFATEGGPDLSDFADDAVFVFDVVDFYAGINDADGSFELRLGTLWGEVRIEFGFLLCRGRGL
jgi:hypothetical protein